MSEEINPISNYQTSYNQLSSELNLDEATRNLSLKLLEQYCSLNSPDSGSHPPIILRCAILIATRYIKLETVGGESIQGCPVSVSQLIQGQDSTQIFVQLKEFMTKVQIDQETRRRCQRIIDSFAFIATFYNKFNEIWNATGLTLPEFEELKVLAWLLFLVIRQRKVMNKFDIVESACLMLAVINTVVREKCTNAQLNSLCSILKTKPIQVEGMMNLVSTALQELTLEGGYQPDSLSSSIDYLSTNYSDNLSLDDIDERSFLSQTFLSSPTKKKVPITPFTKQAISHKQLNSKRAINWDTIETVNLSARLRDIVLPPASPFVPPSTPMTMAMEMNNWLIEITDAFGTVSAVLLDISSRCIPNPLEDLLLRAENFKGALTDFFKQNGITDVTGRNAEFLNQNFGTHLDASSSSTKSNSKATLTIKLYWCVLDHLLTNEDKKQPRSDYLPLLSNDSFHRALLACCLETILFIHNITSISFETVLYLSKVTAFEFWKIINNFLQFSATLPGMIRKHFKEIEVTILSSLGWENESPVHLVVKQIVQEPSNDEVSEGFKNPNSHSYDLFFKKVLSYVAHKITEIGDWIGISDAVKEEIWCAAKYLLSEKTELFISRHIDQLIICTIFGVCKVHSPISFRALLEQYHLLYPNNEGLMKEIKVNDYLSVDVIKFYNTIYIQNMKDYLTGKNYNGARPRISALNPPSPLKANLTNSLTYHGNSPMRPSTQNFMTPRTKKLWAFGESPSQTLKSINTMIQQRASRRIDFEGEDYSQPRKRAKHLQDLLETCPEPLPFRKK